jgi:hypothetical protein
VCVGTVSPLGQQTARGFLLVRDPGRFRVRFFGALVDTGFRRARSANPASERPQDQLRLQARDRLPDALVHAHAEGDVPGSSPPDVERRAAAWRGAASRGYGRVTAARGTVDTAPGSRVRPRARAKSWGEPLSCRFRAGTGRVVI